MNAWLVVIEVNQCPGDLFFHVFLLLQFENMLGGVTAHNDLHARFYLKMNMLSVVKHTYLVELLLKLFVGIIDAKLLKAVDVKCFKPGKADMLKSKTWGHINVKAKLWTEKPTRKCRAHQ